MQREKSLTYKGKRHLPLPSGPYGVGCCDIMTSYLKYGIFIRLYYPSSERGILERYLQWPQWIPHKQYINGYAERIGIAPFIYRRVHKIIVGNLYIPVLWEAELKPTEEKYPVIIFSHGLSAWRSTYSTICLELASRGYVVAALEHRDLSASASFYKNQGRMSTIGSNPTSEFPEMDSFKNFCYSFEHEDSVDSRGNPIHHYQELGPFSQTKEWMMYQHPPKEKKLRLRVQQLKFRVSECSDAIDLMKKLNLGGGITNVLNVNFNSSMFKNKLDLSKCYFMGHSFGGATGISSLAIEPRFKCGIFLDPWMFPFMEDYNCFSEIPQPFLCVVIKSFQTKKAMAALRKLQRENTNSYFLVLKKAHHKDVSDEPFVQKFPFSLVSKLRRRLEKFSALDFTVDLIVRYLEQQMGGCWQSGSPELEILKQTYFSEEGFSSLEVD